MFKKRLFGSRVKTVLTRTVTLLLLTALPVSFLSGPLTVSAFAEETTGEDTDDLNDRSVNGAGEENELTGTAQDVTESNAEMVADLADYLVYILKTDTQKYAGTFASRDGGFPWDTERKTRSWTYYNGIMLDAFLMLDTDAYYQDVTDFYSSNLTADGTVNPQNRKSNTDNGYKTNELDSIPPTRAVFDLLRLPQVQGNPDFSRRYKNLIKYVYEVMDGYPTIEEAAFNFKHKIPKNDPNSQWNTYQFALDGLYMAQPFFMEVANALDEGVLQSSDLGLSDDPGSVSDMLYRGVVNRMLWVGDALYDQDYDTHLYNHGWGPDGVGVNGQYWLRAVGWYAAALADVISMLPDDYSDQKQALIANEIKLFDGMLEHQDLSTGLWYNVINYGPELTEGSGNRLETSGSALMSYAMMKSYAEGYVGDEYGEAGLRAFNGTVGNFLVSSGNSIALQNVYISSGVETYPAGYLTKAYVDNEAKGVGPLMMASTWAEEAAWIHNNPISAELTGNEETITFPLNEVPDFSSSNIQLSLAFDNGTERVIPSAGLTFEGFDPAIPGLQEAAISYNGKQYGTVNVFFEAPAPRFTSQSLVLSGEIGVNFFLTLYGDPADYEGSYVIFTVNGVERDPVALDSGFRNRSGTSYGFTCHVNSLQMAEDITAVYYYGEELNETVETHFSVLDYVNYIEKYSSDYSEKVQELAKAINDYGYYAQQYLSGVHGFTLGEEGQYSEIPAPYYVLGENDFQDAADDLEDFKCYFNEEDEEAELPINGLTYLLALDSKTEIRIYLRLQEGVTGPVYYRIDSDGDYIEAAPQPDGRYMISIENISAHMLGNMYEVTISAGGAERTLNISALSYAQAVLSSERQGDDAKAAMCALLYYYQCAMDYKKDSNY